MYGEWISLRDRYPQITLDAFGVMPNFVHGIIVLDSERQVALTSFARICDDSNLQRVRTLIWENPTQERWFSAGKDWLGLQEVNLLDLHAKIDHRD